MARNLECSAIVIGAVQAAKRRLENMGFRFLTPLRSVRNDRCRSCAKIPRQMLGLRKGLPTDVGAARRFFDRCRGCVMVSRQMSVVVQGSRRGLFAQRGRSGESVRPRSTPACRCDLASLARVPFRSERGRRSVSTIWFDEGLLVVRPRGGGFARGLFATNRFWVRYSPAPMVSKWRVV